MSNDRFLIIPEAWADDPFIMGGAGMMGLYFWLSKNSYYREHTESFEHVGEWVKKGLVVLPFTHERFVDHMEKIGCPLSRRTSVRMLQDLIDGGLVRVVKRGGAGANAMSILAVGFWVNSTARIKILTRNWINSQGMSESTRAELEVIAGQNDARRKAQAQAKQEGDQTRSDKNGTSDLEDRSAKFGTSPSDKNGTSDVAETPSQTMKSESPYTDVPKRIKEQTTSVLPEPAPVAPETSHRETMDLLGQAMYGDAKNVPSSTWPRIAKASGELRKLDPPMLAPEVKTRIGQLLQDGFWKGKLTPANIVDKLAQQRGIHKTSVIALREAQREANKNKPAPVKSGRTAQDVMREIAEREEREWLEARKK